MTYNTLQHGEHTIRDVILALDFTCAVTGLPCLFPFSVLGNDKYASGESTKSRRTAIGQTDLRAKRPDTAHSPARWVMHGNSSALSAAQLNPTGTNPRSHVV